MTPAEVRDRVDAIRQQGDRDPESAHSDEDQLYSEVLDAIAGGVDDPALLAREALKTDELDFPRWCA